MAKKPTIKTDALPRMDGWSNVLTGLGMKNSDKRQNSTAAWQPVLEQEIEELYASDDMAAKIVDKPVDESFRNGFDFSSMDKEDSEELKKQMAAEGLIGHLIHADKTSRIYGGSGLLMVTDDMNDLSVPLADDAELIGATVLNRFELNAQYADLQKNITKPDFLMPRRYMLMPRTTTAEKPANSDYVHASRIIRFDGVWLPNRLRARNSYWHDSVLNRLTGTIRDYSVSFQAASMTVQDFSVAVYKLKNLADLILTKDGETAILNRMAIANLVRSMTRCMILDADGEDFEHQTRSVTGLKDILEKMEDRLVAATDFPHTVLLGTSPSSSGIGESGGHETTNWNSFIESHQEHTIKPRLITLAKRFMVGTEFEDDIDDLDVKFRPLMSLSDDEEATLRYQIAQADQIYFNMGAVDADEIAQSRFGGDEYSMETELDQTLRNPGNRMDPEEPEPVPVVAPAVDPKTGKPLPATPAVPAKPVLKIAKADAKSNRKAKVKSKGRRQK